VISVENLSVRIGAFALDDITFQVPSGQCAVVMGKTGSGKTTILEAVCGLLPVVGGTIRLMDRNVTKSKPAERGIGYVPQDGALFSTMPIRDQLAFALVIRKWSRKDIDHRVDEMADLLGIRHLLDRKPQGLSGGESQRIALGRALAFKPGILCMDEPLSALDDETREDMYTLIESVREHTHVTCLHITHNLSEAKRLADQLYMLRDGDIQLVTFDRKTMTGDAESDASPNDAARAG
jgi:ABC-type sugar transport system ATPase subunit